GGQGARGSGYTDSNKNLGEGSGPSSFGEAALAGLRRTVWPVLIRLTIEHIIPIRRGGGSTEQNLWFSCPTCNKYKGTQLSGRDPKTGRRICLFNPRRQDWFKHFRWDNTGTHIIGITAAGRATVEALQLNNDLSVSARLFWILNGLRPPSE